MSRLAIVVGAGFFGAVMAERLAENGWRVLVLDKRNHLGGNSYSRPDPETGIEEHMYGPHTFHTSSEGVWNYIRRFAAFSDFRYVVWAARKGKIYPLPFGLAVINSLTGRRMGPREAQAWVKAEVDREGIAEPRNLEEKALSLVGRTLYEAFVKEYSEKQWGIQATELPANIITRLPIRFTYNINYHKDRWQGLPLDGYGALFGRMLKHPSIEIRLDTDYLVEKGRLPLSDLLVYTGAIDRFFNYRHGRLGWRSVRFEREVLAIRDFQGTSVINECDGGIPYTRTIEHRHFTPGTDFGEKTIIHREYPFTPGREDDEYYPVRTEADLRIYGKYQAEAAALGPQTLFGGRLGSYQYLDMDKAVAAALACFEGLGEMRGGG